MSHFIGNVEITAINRIENNSEKDVEEIDTLELSRPRVSEMEPSLESITIHVSLIKSLHSTNLSPEEQRENVYSLTSNNAGENTFDYMEYTGFLSVESANIPREGIKSTIAQGTISAIYLPETVYSAFVDSISTPPNDFNIRRGGYIPIDPSVTSPSVRSSESQRKKAIRESVSMGDSEFVRFPKFIKSDNKDTISREKTGMYSTETFSETIGVVPAGKYRLFLRGTGNTVTISNKNGDTLHELELTESYTDKFHLETQRNIQVETTGDVDGVLLVPAHKNPYVLINHTDMSKGEFDRGIQVTDNGKLITSHNQSIDNPVINNGFWTFEPESGRINGTGPEANLSIPNMYTFDRVGSRMCILSSTNYNMYIKRHYPMLEMSGQVPSVTVDVSDADFITGIHADGDYHNTDNWVVALDGSGCLIVASNRKNVLGIGEGEITASECQVLSLGYSKVENLIDTAPSSTDYTVNVPQGMYIAFVEAAATIDVQDSDGNSLVKGDETSRGDYLSTVVDINVDGDITVTSDVTPNMVGLIPVSLYNSIGVQDIAHESMSVTKQKQGVQVR